MRSCTELELTSERKDRPRGSHFAIGDKINNAIRLQTIHIITVRKRSLRRSCFYTCLSVILLHMVQGLLQGACAHGMAWQGGMHVCGRGVCMGACMTGRGCAQGGVHGGGCAWQGACMSGGGMAGAVCMEVGHVWWGGPCMHAPPPHYKIQSVNAQAVCILLECILVDCYYCPPTKLWRGNVFTGVGPHITIIHGALDLTVQASYHNQPCPPPPIDMRPGTPPCW